MGVREIGKDRWWSELFKFWVGVWGQKFSMICSNINKGLRLA